MTAQTPELLARIAGWRAKALEGTLTPAEMKEAIIALRGPRESASHASAASRAKRATAAIPSAADLLAGLE